MLHVAGPGIANFYNIYDPAQGTLNGLISIPEFSNPVQFICGGSFDTAAGLVAAGVLQACRDLSGAVGPAAAPADVQLPADHVPPDQLDHRVQGSDHLRHAGHPGQGADADSRSEMDTGTRRSPAQPGGPAGPVDAAGPDRMVPPPARPRPAIGAVRSAAGPAPAAPAPARRCRQSRGPDDEPDLVARRRIGGGQRAARRAASSAD